MAATARAGQLNATCSSLLKKLCQKYDDLQEIDKIVNVIDKVDSVKLVMQDNIAMALKNCVKLESIDRVAGRMLS